MLKNQFTLRQIRLEDEELLAKHLNNKNVSDGLKVVPYPYSRDMAKEWVERHSKPEPPNNEAQTNCVRVIAIEDELVGTIGLNNIVKNHKATLGYWLAEPFWGHGIMTDVIEHFTVEMFEKFQLKRIWAMHYPSNPASGKVLQKAGFEYEGLMKKNILKNGQYLDSLIYAKIRD